MRHDFTIHTQYYSHKYSGFPGYVDASTSVYTSAVHLQKIAARKASSHAVEWTLFAVNKQKVCLDECVLVDASSITPETQQGYILQHPTDIKYGGRVTPVLVDKLRVEAA